MKNNALFGRFNVVVTLAVLVLVTPLSADPPWVGPGGAGEISYSGGNVGIGEAAPNFPLTVRSLNEGSNNFVQLRGPTSAGFGVVGLATVNGAGLAYSQSGVLVTRMAFTSNGGFVSGFYANGSFDPPPDGAIIPGNVGIGISAPATRLHVNGDTTLVGNISVTGNIAAKYQDVAEWVTATSDLSPGTVVVLNTEKSNEVMASTSAYDTSVAGVVSSLPGLLLGEAGDAKEKIATTGRVKVWVDATKAPVKVGDLLVTGEKSGFAMKSIPVDIAGIKMHRPGTIIGKALEPLPNGTGEILVLLSLQ